MRSKAGIIGAAVLGLTLSAHAFTSPYSSMAVAGSSFSNFWSATPNLVLVADYTWQGVVQVTNSSGAFKFTANGAWDNNWGGVSEGSVSGDTITTPRMIENTEVTEALRDAARSGVKPV